MWNPSYLNDKPLWYDERGVNSLQILTWILAAYEITGYIKLLPRVTPSDQLFLNAYNDLVVNYAYNINIINQKITQPSDDNFSDDELAFLPYFLYSITVSLKSSLYLNLCSPLHSFKMKWH